ncbi:MAG: aspartate--ammonia ligase [Idiomarina sp. 34-48-12]|nr:MAG: aspartate--ammonia ligase [Idiomarina sp. 34-48-12]
MLKHQQQTAQLKQRFTELLCEKLNLTEIQAPLMVRKNSGLQDNLSGHEKAVSVFVRAQQQEYEIVHSLAKWKRSALAHYECPVGEGIVAQMRAIRADEEQLSERHSVLVEQWDWEQVILPSERTLETLKAAVAKIYSGLRQLYLEFNTDDQPQLANEVVFINSEQLRQMYPQLTPKQRESEFTKLHKAVFIIGIGGELADGTVHDHRAPDYDDWSTATETEYAGLNGDLLVWHTALNDAIELSSMGVRVDAAALQYQVHVRSCESMLQQAWHRQLLNGALPECIGGGIGQSRVAMWVLNLAHIKFTQAPEILCGEKPGSASLLSVA